MSDHQTSYTINSMIGHLYLQNKVFQSLSFEDQQSIVVDLIEKSHRSDVNIGEILSNECFSEYEEIDENRTLATLFKICFYCGQPKEHVADYGDEFYPQGLCSDCARENNYTFKK